MVGRTRAIGQCPWIRHLMLVTGILMVLVANGLVVPATPASADPQPTPSVASQDPKPTPSVANAQTLTPQQLTDQIKAADSLRADLMKSSAEVAAANTRLERLFAQANTLLANLSAARTAQVDAETEAATQRARLIELGVAVQGAQDALGQLARDSYIRSGGPLGDIAAVVEALTSPSADQNADSLATVRYLVGARARLFDRLRSLRFEQVTTSAAAEAASIHAAGAAKAAAQAKLELDDVIAEQRSALEGFRAAQAAKVDKAAGLRGALLRSENPVARAADKRLTEALKGQDSKFLMDDSSSCGKDSTHYPNGQLPASALCPLDGAPGQSLSRDASMAFNAMSKAYQQQTGSALCVADSYRSYSEQVAVLLERPDLAAIPGTSQHGLGLATDLCGGVQDFAAPAHLWMQRNAPLYGWFHPAWAEPSGVLPEPWHWEFAS